MSSLSLKDTNILKGVALLLLLIHHLFFYPNDGYDDIHLAGDYYLTNSIAVWSKLCVAIFVFLSGYGLAVGTMKTNGINNVTRFYWHRFTKLLMNYWFIWLLFVPISIFCFGRTFTDAYGSHIIPKFILDFLGILNCFGQFGYNPTWWFYSCIIVLYLSFPFLYKLLYKYPWCFFCLIIAIYFLPLPSTAGVRIYFASFAAGMAYCKFQSNNKAHPSFWLIIFALLSVERFLAKDTIMFDAVLTLALVSLYSSIKLPNYICKPLEFCGKHSMNIFLFHTFIKTFWFKDFIYESHNPIIIFFLLLSICLIISMILEQFKKLIRFEEFVNYIDSLYGIRQ